MKLEQKIANKILPYIIAGCLFLSSAGIVLAEEVPKIRKENLAVVSAYEKPKKSEDTIYEERKKLRYWNAAKKQIWSVSPWAEIGNRTIGIGIMFTYKW